MAFALPVTLLRRSFVVWMGLCMTWEELLKNRVPMQSLRSSAHMLECIEAVKARFPDAAAEEIDKNSWHLMSGVQVLSNPHYACWEEAREVLNVADHP
jgi:hypothetical protein